MTPTILTGYAGFIGGHVCDRWRGDAPLLGLDREASAALGPAQRRTVELAERAAVTDLDLPPGSTVLHLAAEAEVAIPFGRIGPVCDSNVNATLNVLEVLRPERVVFTSTSAIYGNAGAPAATDWAGVKPVGLYGMTKAIGEWACRDWAAETGGAVVILRLGNVVGRACRGFIPFLVRHALAHPDGTEPARARGGGRLVRDYVPVEHVADVIAWAAAPPAGQGGRPMVLNVGTGDPWTNGEIGALVARVLATEGYTLEIDWSTPPLAGEAEAVVLEVEPTRRATGLAIPRREAVEASIEESTRYWLRTLGDGVVPVHQEIE